ncbi:hypothetical protein G6F70_001926 [Rhizopus microsporus]|uniref:Helitron helicase-like domain-containing protein n=1 Tax=Rhizopus microsporus TaxID=58291 RepID=A0A1X0RSN7_RHIZD|nr:hypothetical protein G6F71_003786 [Rhizopus microsporus]KAG1202839.1 hypothetical protein G6F70_001926 [Rhizopus microsporus]KAG1212487.1 hypothetical protein G6F69_003671 [Rhizopus microsporus]KAG1234522.1 hypothetical protein G6F67_003471 [Rhizopus microsporus]KAG1266477.1 hypothetical protein G6F68_002714 [Rhizopus microsporus]
MENNTSRTVICSSCVATLPTDSRYRTCQACRERTAASRCRRRVEQEEQEGSPPDPPEYLKNLLASTDAQGHHFKDNLRQYNAVFAFTSLGCDIVSAEERNANNSRGGLNTFQIHGVLCHRQGPLLSVEGDTPLYAQLYIYDPSYGAQRRSERNKNLDNEIIENPSTLLSQHNLFVRIYRHAYKILANHESFRINSEDRATSNGSTESGSPYKTIDVNAFD